MPNHTDITELSDMNSPVPPYVHTPPTEGPEIAKKWDTPLHRHTIQENASSALKKGSVGAPLPQGQHPDAIHAGIEAVSHEDGDKEVVYYPREQYAHYAEEKPPQDVQPTQKPRRRICGLRIPLCLALLALLIVALIVGLGVGLGLGLRKRTNGSDRNSIDPRYLSKHGAANGTGIALTSQLLNIGSPSLHDVYFQHWTGDLRRIHEMADGSWQGGDSTENVASDARMATPISAVGYGKDYKSSWHIFYIDKNNQIREKINDNTTNIWRDGPLGELNLTATSDTGVGLQACWFGSFYGENTTSSEADVGMNLWYGETATTLREVTWTYDTGRWLKQDSFAGNGHAGIACYTWGPTGSIGYRMTVNLANQVQVAWKERNASVLATDTHPVSTWVNLPWTIPDVDPNTSLGFTEYLYAQQADGSIAGYNISWDAERTELGAMFTIPQKPLLGTHFSVTANQTDVSDKELVVFNQESGTDITQNVRDSESGQWSYLKLPIPQD